MTEVKLLSIKIKPEHAYFFENDGATFDSNSNKVAAVPPPAAGGNNDHRRMSRKARKAAEKEQKKLQKKELEQRKKEMKKSTKMKNSQKTEIQDNADMKTDKSMKENGEVNLPQFSNPVFQDETLGRDENVNMKENVPPTSSVPEASSPNAQSAGASGVVTDVQEESVTFEISNQEEEAPQELSLTGFKPKPEFEQGQHVEVEISEVTELEDMSGSNGTGSESEITMAIIQEVESGLDLDSFFIEVYGETGEKTSQEKRKSVRFEEPQTSEQDTDSKAEENDGKTTENDGKTTENDNENEEDKVAEASEQCVKPQSDERIDKEQSTNVESCEMDLDELFELCDEERSKSSEAQLKVENDANTSEVENHRIKIASDDISPNGKPSEQHGETGSKTEKRKKGGLLKCCFS